MFYATFKEMMEDPNLNDIEKMDYLAYHQERAAKAKAFKKAKSRRRMASKSRSINHQK